MRDDTKRIVFVVIAIILLLSIILPLVAARFEDQNAELSAGKMTSLRCAWNIARFLTTPALILWIMLVFYSDWMRNKIYRIEQAAQIKIVVSIIWWLNIAILILLTSKYLIVLYCGSDRPISASIKFVLFSLCFGSFLAVSWQWLQYFRTKPLCNIVAGCLLEQHEKFVKANKLDKAYSVLLKACETAPEGLWLWCKLAVFCETHRKNPMEADRYMARAGELIMAKKVKSDSEKACYFDYLGLISHERGDLQKGLEYWKQAIDIDPKPERVKLYNQMLTEFNSKKQNT